MWRGTGGRVDDKYLVIIKEVKDFQYRKKRELREVKEINLASGERRMLEITSRTKFIAINGFFSVEKVYEEKRG